MWIFHRPEEDLPELRRVEMPHNLHWKDELDSPGAWQLQVAKRLFLSRPFLSRRPAQSFLPAPAGGQRALAGDGFLFVYTPRGAPIEVDLSRLPWSDHVVWWYDPRTGATTRLVAPEDGLATFSPPGTPYRGNDWVLVIDDAGKGYAAPGTVSAPHLLEPHRVCED